MESSLVRWTRPGGARAKCPRVFHGGTDSGLRDEPEGVCRHSAQHRHRAGTGDQEPWIAQLVPFLCRDGNHSHHARALHRRAGGLREGAVGGEAHPSPAAARSRSQPPARRGYSPFPWCPGRMVKQNGTVWALDGLRSGIWITRTACRRPTTATTGWRWTRRAPPVGGGTIRGFVATETQLF